MPDSPVALVAMLNPQTLARQPHSVQYAIWVEDKELKAEVVRSGLWKYDNQITHEVWIVKQNFDYYYDEGFEDEPESLNPDGELFQVVFAQNGRVISVSDSKHSLDDAVQHAERVIPQGIQWTNHFLQELFLKGGYSATP